ncbi:MAG: alpha-hydroxy acid oxidase [Polaromonas sp.]|jgi:(S)-mandelate dehydrogenase|nr:alpha-hydroxy acid oxidase [Polaromonas sp.]
MPSPSKAAWRKGSPKLARIELVTRIDVLASGPVKCRQLDGAVATLDALPAVVRAVNGRMPVLLDGGVRRGSDVFKAIALGAAGVLVGRSTLYGAVAAGEEGAQRALAILRDEFTRTMQLSGACSVADIHARLLFEPALRAHSTP